MRNSAIHKTFSHKVFWVIMITVFVSVAYGALAAPDPSRPFENFITTPCSAGSGESCFYQVLKKLADFVIVLGIPFLVVMGFVTGFRFIAAQGNEKKLEEVKRMFFYVVVAAAIIFGARIVVDIVKNFADTLGP